MIQEMRKEERHSCAMPGLLKLLRPEDTFTPLRLPVLILDMSANGALIRLHPTALKMPMEELKQRSFSLKVANATLSSLRGFVVWSHRTEEMCLLGLQFHKSCPAVDELARRGAIGSEDSSQQVPSVPLLYPYKTYCEEPSVILEGEAYRATQVVIRTEEGKELIIAVQNAFFRCELPLRQNAENRFTLCAANDDRKSPDVEISVLCAPDPVRTAFQPRATYRVTRDSGEACQSLQISFNGTPREAEDFLRLVPSLLAEGKRNRMEVRVTTGTDFEASRLKALSRKLQDL